jgi:hypothetical protein
VTLLANNALIPQLIANSVAMITIWIIMVATNAHLDALIVPLQVYVLLAILDINCNQVHALLAPAFNTT